MSKLYLLTGAQKTTLESWTSYTETTRPQALTSITPGDYHLYRVSDVASGTVIAAQSVPTLFSSSYGSIVSSGAPVLALPTHATDDILVYVVIQRASGLAQDLSGQGWTTIVNVAPSVNSGYIRVVIYAKRAASGAETAPTMSSPGGPNSVSWMVIRGCATGTLTDAVKVVGSNSTTSSGLSEVTLAAANGVADDKSLILMAVGTTQAPDQGSLLTGPFVNAAFTSITTRNAVGGTGTQIHGRYLATAEKAVAGAISSSTAPITGGTYSTATLSFKPV